MCEAWANELGLNSARLRAFRALSSLRDAGVIAEV